MWYLYILECKDGSYYTGITKDIPRRIEMHNAGKGARYTRSHRPVKLVYFAEYEIESEVRKREVEVKSWRREKYHIGRGDSIGMLVTEQKPNHRFQNPISSY